MFLNNLCINKEHKENEKILIDELKWSTHIKISLNITLPVFSQKITVANTYIKSKKDLKLLILTAEKLEQSTLYPKALPKQTNKQKQLVTGREN